SGAVESREGARSARERAATKGREKTMTRRVLTSIGLVAFLFVFAAPRGTKAADPSRLRTTISTLASERFGGRLTGTDGERLAREFIIAELKRIGAKPLPGQRDFTLPF